MRAICRWVISALVIGSPAYADGISGTYVGKAPNSAILVQLVETTGGQLTGRYEQTLLGADGKLVRTTETITGASDGHTIVLTIKPTELLSDSISASGSFSGSMLHLSGGGGGKSIDLTLAKTDETAYQNYVAFLAGQGARISEQQTQAEQFAKICDLIPKIATYSAAAKEQLANFPPIEQRFKAITNWMDAALSRQRSIFGDGQANVARGQIGVAINQAAIQAYNLHDELMSSHQAIANQLRPTLNAAAQLAAVCQSDITAKNANFAQACAQLSEALKNFKPNLDALDKSFQEAEAIWNEEHRKQQTIVHASDVASR